MDIPLIVAEQAKSFLKNERQFRLGYLPTEQAYPRTADFSKVICKDTRRGVHLLLSVDRDIASGANRLVQAFRKSAAPFARKALIIVGGTKRRPAFLQKAYHIRCNLPSSPLRLWHHLAMKLTMNTLSTGTMGRLERVEGNWMTHVHPTNKKLIDHGTRLIAELTGLDYDQACLALFAAIDAVKKLPADRQSIMSPVVYALKTIAQDTARIGKLRRSIPKEKLCRPCVKFSR